MFICIILLLKEVKRSFLLTKRRLGAPETIGMLSVGVLQVSLLAGWNSVRIILLMLWI